MQSEIFIPDFTARRYVRYSQAALTEAHYEASPYAYVINDPVKRIDINGLIDGITIFRGAVTTLSGALATAGGIVAFLQFGSW